tara:strand:+ start:153 stop:284 length:132 start_codon:yes stop_codon:yes gene_type:complete
MAWPIKGRAFKLLAADDTVIRITQDHTIAVFVIRRGIRTPLEG